MFPVGSLLQNERSPRVRKLRCLHRSPLPPAEDVNAEKSRSERSNFAGADQDLPGNRNMPIRRDARRRHRFTDIPGRRSDERGASIEVQGRISAILPIRHPSPSTARPFRVRKIFDKRANTGQDIFRRVNFPVYREIYGGERSRRESDFPHVGSIPGGTSVSDIELGSITPIAIIILE